MIADRWPAGPRNALTDVPGIRVGHHTAVGGGYLTGTTVVAAPDHAMAAGVDVRGSAPGTRETDLLAPTATVEHVDAIVLSGGSAYGLDACSGVADALGERGIGAAVGPTAQHVVPIVLGAVIFDFARGGDPAARPNADFGRRALDAALGPGGSDGTATGAVGAGTGAVAGGLKGGLGTASAVLPSGTTVGALVVVNSAGSPVDPETGLPLAARLLLPADADPLPPVPQDARDRLVEIVSARPPAEAFALSRRGPTGNTTLAVVATDASLTKAQCTRVAIVAQDGYARALDPVHTALDGDLVFGASTRHRPAPDGAEFHDILVAAATVTARAIVRAVLAAPSITTPAGFWPGWRDVVAGVRH